MKSVLSVFKKPLVLSTLALLVVGGTAYFFYSQSRALKSEVDKLKNQSTSTQAEENKKLVSQVGTLMSLPESEDPTIATITDREKLKDQNFFAKSENGDRVLIYPQARKAILFRPSTNKIIEVAPVNIGATQSAQTAGSTTTPTPTKRPTIPTVTP